MKTIMSAAISQRKPRLLREILAHVLQRTDRATAAAFLTVSKITTGPAIEAFYRDLEVNSQASMNHLTAMLSGTSNTAAGCATLALRSIRSFHFRLGVAAVRQPTHSRSRHVGQEHEDAMSQVVKAMSLMDQQGLGPIYKLSVDPVFALGFGLTLNTFTHITCLALAMQSANEPHALAAQLPLCRYVPNLRNLKIVFKAKSSMEYGPIASQISGLQHLKTMLLDFRPHFTATYDDAGPMHMMDAWGIERDYHRRCSMLVDSLLAPTCILPSLEHIRLLTPDYAHWVPAEVCKDAARLVIGREPAVKLSFRRE